ncbi:hypothetical protein OS493_030033 [Desmophyllum pertusum]|uniref:Uncharacterized protein n=1 Tax=Desmophyllum pertusum TaxID=174260 RepID=A0A9W9ZNI3_9CNID|nr:hypothetical protein OS493_030033 [Desmophyllum pertusum]
MAAHLCVEDPDNKAISVAMNAFIQVCHNVVLLGLRLGCLGNGWNGSMFIAKNVITICVRCHQFCRPGMSDIEDVDPQNNPDFKPTAPPPPARNPAHGNDRLYTAMAIVKTSIIVGRFAFFVLMVMQCCFLASYPAYYEDEGDWYAVIILFIPAGSDVVVDQQH